MIEGLSDQEKSVLLARAMGWTVHELVSHPPDIFAPPDIWIVSGSLYHPANMALAWRVHLFACNHRFGNNSHWPYLAWFEQEKIFEYEDGQSRWLDKILELAIEAGITEEQW